MNTLLHKRTKVLQLLVFVLIALLMFPSILMAMPQEQSEGSAESAAQSSEVDVLQRRATQARLRLDQLGFETELASENYFEAQELLEATLAEIEEAEARLEANQEQLDYVSGLLSDRAVDMYRGGELSFVIFLFGSNSISELVDRVDIVQGIMENDANMMRETRILRAEIENTKFRLEENREIEQAAAERAQEEFETIQSSLTAQQNLLGSLDDEIYGLIEAQRAEIAAVQIAEAEARQAAGQTSGSEDTRVAQATPPANNGGTSGNGSNGSAGNNSSSGTTSNQNTNRPPAGGTGNNSANNNANNNNSSGNNNAGSGNNSGNAGSGGSGSTGGGNSSGGGSTPAPTPPPAPPANNNPSLGRERPGVVPVARRFVGVTPYLWGGTTPAGFDCSGLVQFAYREAYGINLPRTSRQQFHAGVFIPPNRMDLMRPGDLVFFSSTGRPADIHHVGIFIGNNRMIHAPSSGRFVSEQAIWRHDFIGAVRP